METIVIVTSNIRKSIVDFKADNLTLVRRSQTEFVLNGIKYFFVQPRIEKLRGIRPKEIIIHDHYFTMDSEIIDFVDAYNKREITK